MISISHVKLLSSLRKSCAILTVALLCLSMQACDTALTDAEYLQHAQAAYQNGDMNAAVIDLKNALKANPQNAEARFLLGSIYVENGDGVSAEKELRIAQKANIDADRLALPLARALLLQRKYDELLKETNVTDDMPATTRADLHAVRGQSLLYSGNTEQAIAELNLGLAADANSVPALLGQALVQRYTGNLDEARQWIDKALQLHPDNALALGTLANIEEASGNPEAAEAAYGKAIAATKRNSIYYLQRAFLRLQRDDIDGAVADANQLPKDHPARHQILGVKLFQEKKYPDAQIEFESALRFYPNYAPALYYLGLTHFTQGHAEQANDYLTKFLKLVPESASAANMLASLQVSSGDLDTAESLVNDVLNRTPDDLPALRLLAQIKTLRNDPRAVVPVYEKLVILEPDNADFHAKYGMSLISIGEFDKGTAEMQRAVALNPDAEALQLQLFIGQLQAKDADQALKFVQRWVDNNPQSAPAHLSLGWALMANQKPKEAQAAFLKTLEISPGNPSASHNLAVFALLANRPQEAIDLYKASLKIYPEHPRTTVALGEVYQRIGAPQEAIKLVEPLWKKGTQTAAVGRLLSELYLQTDDPKRALAIANPLRAAFPDDPDVLMIAGAALAENEQYNQAISVYRRLIEIQPNSAKAHYLLSQLYYRQNQSKDFANSLEKAYQLAPDDFEIEISMAGLYRSRQQFSEAQKLLEDLQTRHAREPQVYIETAMNASAQRHHSDAAKAYAAALDLAPDRSDIAVKYALELLQAGQKDNAVSTLEDWLSRKPEDRIVQYNLANLYLLVGQTDKATSGFQRVLEQQPDHVLALNNLAWLLRDSQPKKALEFSEKAYKLAPESPAVQDTLGMILLAQKDQQPRAVRLLETAHNTAPQNREIAYHYALALSRIGKQQQAKLILVEILGDELAFSERSAAQKLLDSLGG